jgi:hypothetical protein
VLVVVIYTLLTVLMLFGPRQVTFVPEEDPSDGP